ncbi:MAG: PD40 domain-containing protein [Chloroflexi bacterium]|nr:PD40 domain-containing protein [Chloroflexota bacterium]
MSKYLNWLLGLIVALNAITSQSLNDSRKAIAQEQPSNLGLAYALSTDGKFIAYSLANGSQSDIWTLEIDSGDRVNLTEGIDGNCSEPQWSPNTESVVFTCDSAIWIVDRGTLAPVQITPQKSDSNFGLPRWSPDANYIAYESLNSNEGMNIWLFDTVSHESFPITDFNSPSIIIGYQAWSPDSQVIAFVHTDFNKPILSSQMYGFVRVANPKVYYFVPLLNSSLGPMNWSTNGEHIVAISWSGDESYILSINKFTQDVAHLARVRQANYHYLFDAPQYSPDGSRLLFTVDRENNLLGQDIWVMNADGTDAANLTDSSGVSETQPYWFPDGERIVFFRKTETSDDIWVMNADGSNLINLTGNATQN